jgi:AraC family transcriptional regulator of adaptative response/methylated-DNA-[protein]-cysteine methyltransferase
VAANPIAWLIPCHRVLRADGALGGYHWGTERKRAMLAWEQLRAASQDHLSSSSPMSLAGSTRL